MTTFDEFKHGVDWIWSHDDTRSKALSLPVKIRIVDHTQRRPDGAYRAIEVPIEGTMTAFTDRVSILVPGSFVHAFRLERGKPTTTVRFSDFVEA